MSHSSPNLQTQPTRTTESIQDWLVEQLAMRLEMDVDDIDIQASFESFGLESAEALVLLSKLEQWLGHSVSPVLIWNYPTIEQLSERLAEGDLDSSE
jgi:acyl carrier protein